MGASWAGMLESGASSERIAADFRRATRVVMTVGAAIAVASFVAVAIGERLFAERLGLPPDNELVPTFAMFALSIPLAVVSFLGIRMLIAGQRTDWMPLITMTTLLLNLGLDIVLSRAMGTPGIALASTCVVAFNATSYVWIARRQVILVPRRQPSTTSGVSSPASHQRRSVDQA
jgi:peptidoglycan biosynthesis protein MviN/MurJ (putative lipid II flippase)